MDIQAMAGQIYSFATTFGGAILAVGIILLFHIAIKCRLALWRFKRQSKGLPIYDNIQLLGNTIFTLGAAPDIIQKAHEAHKRIGKTFGWLSMTRYGVHTIDLDLLKRIVVDEGHINRTRTDFPLQEVENSILMAEDDHWRKLRRQFAPAFKSSKFKNPNVLEEIDNSIQMLLEYVEKKIDRQTKISPQLEADDLLHRFSLQVVLSCFYKQYSLIKFNDEPCYWTSEIDEMIEAVSSNLMPKIALVFPSLNPVLDWLIRHFHPQGAWRQSMMSFIRRSTKLALDARNQLNDTDLIHKSKDYKIIRNKFEMNDGTQFKRNMMDSVIDKYLDGKLNESEFFNSAFLILFAADKTTTDAMVHLMYLLAMNPKEQDECREAILRYGYEAEYLSWSINEALRLLPPVPAGCSRTIDRDMEIENGHVIPAGSFVISSVYTIHRLREYWGEDADDFKPTRWKDTSHHHPFQFLPFGYGQRGCLGREFALFEMKKLFAALLTRYKLEAKQKGDAYMFKSVHLTMIIPNSKTFVTIKRL